MGIVLGGGLSRGQHAAIPHTSAMIGGEIETAKLKKFAVYLFKRPPYPASTTSSTSYVSFGDILYIPKSEHGYSNAKITFSRSGQCWVRLWEDGYGEASGEWENPGGTQTLTVTVAIPYGVTRWTLQFKSQDGSPVELQGGVMICY